MGEQFCLKWNNHQENLTGIMTKLLAAQKFIDVSLVCEMKTFKAHQTVLSACSPYFDQVLEENRHPHPIIILKDVKEGEMSALLQYMYKGEVNVRDDELSAFLHTARALQVRGLSENKKEYSQPQPPAKGESTHSVSPNAQSVTVNPLKRRRVSSSTTESEQRERVVPDRLHSDCQAQIPNVCKVSPKPPSSSAGAAVSNYTENSSDVHYVDNPGSNQTIKQELESTMVTNEDPYPMPHHMTNDPGMSHKAMDWEYHHGYDGRSYHSQKVELPKVPLPMTHSFSSQLQAPPLPALYPCNSKAKPKKDPPYENKPKMDAPGPSYATNHPVSVIRNTEFPDAGGPTMGMQRKGGRFRPGWMENYAWLQYDEGLNTMFCKTCRKWSSTVPDIRTSFVEGNGNFRLEIVNHHDKSKAHRMCMAKEEEAMPRVHPIEDGRLEPPRNN